MANAIGTVEVNVNHVQFIPGAMESPTIEDQQPDPDRFRVLLELIDRACGEAGFVRRRTEKLESVEFRGGHLPELHMVLVQLPGDLVRMTQEAERLARLREQAGGR